MGWLTLSVLVPLLLTGCALAGPPQGRAPTPLSVMAAASLQDAFTEMGEAFHAANPDVTVTFSFAGSQELAQQLAQGAPADLFASANESQMEAAVAAGRVVEGSAQPFARNHLVIVTPADNPAAITQPAELARPGLRLVLADQAVPAGRYTLDFLAAASADPAFGAGYQEAVLANVRSFDQNVRAVLSKVTLGEADAAIVYMSDAYAAGNAVRQISLPEALNPMALYPIAPISDSPNPTAAHRFMDFVRSPDGQAILARYGFLPISTP